MLILFGRATKAALVGSQQAYCGGCLQETSQAVYALASHTHIYFAQVGESVEVGHVASCSQCRSPVPIREDFDEEIDDLHRVDAFLDHHQMRIQGVFTDARPLLVGCLSALGVLVGSGVAAYLGSLLVGEWSFLLGPVGAIAAFVVFHTRRTEWGHRGFERTIEPTLKEIHRQTGWDLDDLMNRADQRGCLELRDFLAWTAIDLEHEVDAGPG